MAVTGLSDELGFSEQKPEMIDLIELALEGGISVNCEISGDE